jgi:hypothetical protein
VPAVGKSHLLEGARHGVHVAVAQQGDAGSFGGGGD